MRFGFTAFFLLVGGSAWAGECFVRGLTVGDGIYDGEIPDAYETITGDELVAKTAQECLAAAKSLIGVYYRNPADSSGDFIESADITWREESLKLEAVLTSWRLDARVVRKDAAGAEAAGALRDWMRELAESVGTVADIRVKIREKAKKRKIVIRQWSEY